MAVWDAGVARLAITENPLSSNVPGRSHKRATHSACNFYMPLEVMLVAAFGSPTNGIGARLLRFCLLCGEFEARGHFPSTIGESVTRTKISAAERSACNSCGEAPAKASTR